MPLLLKAGRPGVRLIHLSQAQGRGSLVFPGWYPRDHKPGRYPQNEEERRAAAIRPIDPNNVTEYCGDYPDLGVVTFEHKDPYENFTDPVHRRNWGEQTIFNFMKHRADRNTFTGLDVEDFTFVQGVIMSLIVIVPMCAFFVYSCDSNPESLRWKNPVMPKQYAWDYYPTFPFGNPTSKPIKNYTFEPAE